MEFGSEAALIQTQPARMTLHFPPSHYVHYKKSPARPDDNSRQWRDRSVRKTLRERERASYLALWSSPAKDFFLFCRFPAVFWSLGFWRANGDQDPLKSQSNWGLFSSLLLVIPPLKNILKFWHRCHDGGLSPGRVVIVNHPQVEISKASQRTLFKVNFPTLWWRKSAERQET